MSYYLMGMEFHLDNEKILDIDRGDNCTAM